MRELMLKRIEEIRTENRGFPITTMRWKNFTHGTENKHLKDVDFESLNDVELLFLFERLIRSINQMM